MTSPEMVWSVSDFVGVFNQAVNYSFPSVVIEGELANFRISKNRWVYFDLKDEQASVRFFGSVFQLPGPLEDGLMLQVIGVPQLHPQFGFSITISSVKLSGEGSIKKAAKLLEAKLKKEGLFDESRKRTLPHAPQKIGLITSGESAAYADFVKVTKARWPALEIVHYDVQVQGVDSETQINRAVDHFNAHTSDVEALVVIRGGGSADDLQVFSAESIVRSIASSRIPTIVAIGHEVDISLAELAADQRASTPSNAAELLVPDMKDELSALGLLHKQLANYLQEPLRELRHYIHIQEDLLDRSTNNFLQQQKHSVSAASQLLGAYNPKKVLARGYSLIYRDGKIVRSAKILESGQSIEIELRDGRKSAKIE